MNSGQAKPNLRGVPASGISHQDVFPEMKGCTVEQIEVSLSPDYHCVSIRFEDKTDFTVEIDTRLVCHALHSDWKTGSMRVLKRWPPRTGGFVTRERGKTHRRLDG